MSQKLRFATKMTMAEDTDSDDNDLATCRRPHYWKRFPEAELVTISAEHPNTTTLDYVGTDLYSRRERGLCSCSLIDHRRSQNNSKKRMLRNQWAG
jgi:hypothetical protein